MSDEMVMVRIKRQGGLFMSCGIGLRNALTPEQKKTPQLKYLCPKLVPGQVVKVPAWANTLNQSCIEVVRRVEPDEILRPLIFNSTEDAILADPSNRTIHVDKIQEGRSLAQFAGVNRHEKRQEALDAQEEYGSYEEHQAQNVGEDIISENEALKAQLAEMQTQFDEFIAKQNAQNNQVTRGEKQEIEEKHHELNDPVEPPEATEDAPVRRKRKRERR